MGTHPRTEWMWTRDAQSRPWIFQCDIQGCFWRTAHRTYFDAEDQRISHPCPLGGGSLPKGKSLLDEIWERLDDLVDQIRDETERDPKYDVALRAEAKGIASVIAILCNRHYSDTYAVGKEATRRYKIRKGLIEGPPSVHEIAPRGVADSWKLENKPGRRPVEGAAVRSWVGQTESATPSREFSESEKTMIRGMKNSGLPLQAIARTFKATVPEIAGI